MNIGDTFQQTTEDGTIVTWKVVAKVPIGVSEFGDVEWLGDEVKVVEVKRSPFFFQYPGVVIEPMEV